jgi:hypothetical protein
MNDILGNAMRKICDTITAPESKTQVERLRESFENGRRLGQLEMLNDLGIGNHTGRICDLRKKLLKEGKPLDYILTEMKAITTRYGSARVAIYYKNPKYNE